MDDQTHDSNRITTALLLAAGTGSRLMPITSNSPKCLTLVNEQSILERLVINLKKQGFKRLVVVTGYQENCIKDFLAKISGDLTIEFVYSPLYRTTNNIYSLWMAREIINEPFVLFEADLIFDVTLLDNMVYPDRMATSSLLPWMNGTTVTVDASHQVKGFHKNTTPINVEEVKYKTVNIYSFSLQSWKAIVKRLDIHIEANNVNGYYETVIGELVADNRISLKAVDFDNKYWYEVDTVEDLKEAEKLFALAVKKPLLSKSSIGKNLEKLKQFPKGLNTRGAQLATS
ncbi:MAG: phosphocholine cytidylyltransferase family protein [Crocinitomicaceae bacterium]|nr:phosphocholine cytidylyltransferase family protein [Flavobacteriales bacterium]NQZ36181.1 phosphocholine cytidylyltransferase family protein [Crocinitomicaceae bacterium]